MMQHYTFVLFYPLWCNIEVGQKIYAKFTLLQIWKVKSSILQTLLKGIDKQTNAHSFVNDKVRGRRKGWNTFWAYIEMSKLLS